MAELIGGAGVLGWVAVKAVLLFAVAVIGLRLGERRTLAQLSAFDFAVAVAIGAIIGRGATATDTSFATSAVALVTLLVAHRVVAIARLHSRVIRLIDHPPRVLVAHGQLQAKELARAGLTDADVYALLRENGVGDLSQVGYLLYETRGTVTVTGADREPGPLMRDALNASGYRPAPQERPASAVTDSEHDDLEPADRPHRSFRDLIGHLATLTRNQVRASLASPPRSRCSTTAANVNCDIFFNIKPFPSWLCFAELQYVGGLGELTGAPGGGRSRPTRSSTSPPLA